MTADNCIDLAGAVIRQAFIDGCAPAPGQFRIGGCATPSDRGQAWHFLTAVSGEWALARETWCGLTGVDPDMIREKALALGPARGAVASRSADAAPARQKRRGA